jgi:hypothetical protein
MPELRFTVEEAPRLLRALASHDAELFDRVMQSLEDTSLPKRQPSVVLDLVHISRAER